MGNRSTLYIDTGIIPTKDTVFRLKCIGAGYETGDITVGNYNSDTKDYRLFFYASNGTTLMFDYNDDRIQNTNWGGVPNGQEVDITAGNYYVYDNIKGENICTGATKSQDPMDGLPIKVCVGQVYTKSLEIWQGQTKVFDGKAAYDDSTNNIGLFDSVSNTLVYNPNLSMGKGADVHILSVTPSILKFESTGGTLSFTVAAETGWTCTTPSAFTISTTAGTSGDTVVTVTAPNYTGSTRIDEDITLTDDDGYTASVHLRQKPVSTGVQSNIYLGNTNIEVFKLGGKAVESIYLGDVQVYAQGEFQGLKTIPKTVGLNIIYQSKDIKVKSSEPWTLSIDPSAAWLSASTVSGDSGVTVVTLTVDTGATSGQSAVTTVISATSANYSAATTVEYAEYAEYYMHKNSGQPLKLLLPINPRQIYDNDNNYIKWVFAVMNESREYTYMQTDGGQWFSYEGNNAFHYFNLGGGASYRPYLNSGNSNGRLLPITAVVDNGHFTANWNGIDYDYGNINYNLTNDQQVLLLPTGGASDFFFIYFYNKAGNLIYKFEPYKMMVNNVEVKGIIDKLTGTMYTTQQGSGTYDILDFDQGDWN